MRTRLIVFGYPLVEIATIYVVAQFIGWLWTLLLLLAAIPAGLAVMRNAGDGAMRDLAATAEANAAALPGVPARQPDAGRHALTFVGGLLIAIPGFWTDLVGVLLVIPVTQRLFRSRSRAWLERRFTVVRMPGIRYPGMGDVVQGTVIVRDDEKPRPEAGRGEIGSGPQPTP